jgi:type IV secretory pathway VirJ component
MGAGGGTRDRDTSVRRRLGAIARGAHAALCILAGAATALAAQSSGRAVPPTDLSELPLHTVPATAGAPVALALLLTGDGGWASIDRRIAGYLAAHGVAVVGLDSRAYLMRRRTPDETASDVGRVIRRFTAVWAVTRVAVIGYSRGADIAPFVANRLAPDVRQQLALVALLGPGDRASFQFHWLDLLRDAARPSDPPVLPELERLRGTPVLCVCGAEEEDSLCRLADTSAVRVDRRPGGHHFDRNYDVIAAEIVDMLAPADPGGR